MNNRVWKVGELSRLTGLTIRTLHHYDEIGLLTPMNRTDSGHRLYSELDIVKLQQIMSFRELGFSLDEIKNMLQNHEYSPQEVIKMQIKRLDEEIKIKEELKNQLKELEGVLDTLKKPTPEQFIKAIQLIIGQSKYFTQEQRKKLNEQYSKLNHVEMKKFDKLIYSFQAEMKKGMPINSPAVIELAKMWQEGIDFFLAGDEEIIKSAERFYSDNPKLAEDYGMSDELYKYITSALSILNNRDSVEMNDYIIKTLAYDKGARILFVDNTDIVKQICNHKNMSKVLKTALGKIISIGSLISGTLKDNQRVSLRVNATNRRYKILVDVNSMGNVRGYINDELLNAPIEYLNDLSIEELIGDKGYIQMMKDIGMNSIFTGITEMPYGNISDDFSYYFHKSEQIPSFFFLTILFNEKNEIILSRGVLAQLLPGTPISIIDDIKKVILENDLLLSSIEKVKDFNEIPKLLFDDIKIIGFSPIQFFCECSKEIFYHMLRSLSKEELLDAYKNEEQIEMSCSICGKKYIFNKGDISELI